MCALFAACAVVIGLFDLLNLIVANKTAAFFILRIRPNIATFPRRIVFFRFFVFFFLPISHVGRMLKNGETHTYLGTSNDRVCVNNRSKLCCHFFASFRLHQYAANRWKEIAYFTPNPNRVRTSGLEKQFNCMKIDRMATDTKQKKNAIA